MRKGGLAAFVFVVPNCGALPCLVPRSRLHSNNLYCDCHLAWLSDWLRQRPRVGLYTQCMAPSHLRGHNVAEVQKREFVCSGKRNPATPTDPSALASASFCMIQAWRLIKENLIVFMGVCGGARVLENLV